MSRYHVIMGYNGILNRFALSLFNDTKPKDTVNTWMCERVNMNKQQLATKIWESANKMRSKIEANEYKDYILGFIFYKYLSDKELKFLKANGFTQSDIESLEEDIEEGAESRKFIRNM